MSVSEGTRRCRRRRTPARVLAAIRVGFMSELSKSFVVGGLGQGIELLTLGHVLSRIATAQQAQLPNASFFRTVGDLYVEELGVRR